MIYIAVIFMTFIGALGALLFKKSTSKIDKIRCLLHDPYFYLGCFLYALSALMNMILLRFMDYTILYPMTAVTYIWSQALSYKFMGELITKNKLAGVMLICIGVVFLAK